MLGRSRRLLNSTAAARPWRLLSSPALQQTKGSAAVSRLAAALAACTTCSIVYSTEAVESEKPAGDSRAPADPVMLAKQNTSRTRLKHYPYVIIGAGTTALNAMEAIFEEDPQAQVLMLTSEHTLPRFDVYTKKGALAPDLMASYKEWRQHVTSRLEDEPASFVTHTFNLQLGMKSLKLDSERRTLIMDDDKEVTFDRCLIATEGKPRQFYVLDSEKSSYFLRDRINTLSNLFDFEALSEVQQSLGVRHVTVVGGGFLGTEIALACAKRGMAVAQVYAETAPLCRHLPIYLALEVQSRLKAHGVMPIAERLVTDVRSGDPDEEEDRDKIHVTMMGWKTDNFSTEYLVLASTHIDPVVDVGKESGLEIDAANGGILVNGQLEAVCGIYAAGACASYHDKALGRRRVDMFDHSVASGKLVGKNMALRNTRGASYRYKRRRTRRGAGTDREGKIGHLYNYQPVFESHLAKLDVHIQDKGGEGSHVPPGNPKLTRGIVYYLKGSTIVGMMLWNAGDLVDKARKIMSDAPTITSTEGLKSLVALAPDAWLHVIETKQVESNAAGPAAAAVTDEQDEQLP